MIPEILNTWQETTRQRQKMMASNRVILIEASGRSRRRIRREWLNSDRINQHLDTFTTQILERNKQKKTNTKQTNHSCFLQIPSKSLNLSLYGAELWRKIWCSFAFRTSWNRFNGSESAQWQIHQSIESDFNEYPTESKSGGLKIFHFLFDE